MLIAGQRNWLKTCVCDKTEANYLVIMDSLLKHILLNTGIKKTLTLYKGLNYSVWN